MKTMRHPLILATTRQVDKPGDETGKEPIIRLKLDKPPHWDWQLTTTSDDLPVIQLLDRDGRVLVETTGRVAQRARGTFRDGIKFHETFPEPLKEESPPPPPTPPVKISTGNRNYEGFSTKYGPVSFGFRPKKSSSEATVSSSTSSHRRGNKDRKRHSANESELEKLVTKKEVKRYSAGDYLRQQILEDLDNDEETKSEVARNRYKKMKAYLRSQSDSGAQFDSAVFDKSTNEKPVLAGKSLTKEDLDKIRRFLQDKIHAKMQEEHSLQRTLSFPVQSNKDAERSIGELSLEKHLRKRHSDSPKSDEKPGVLKNYRTRKIRSDANIRFGPEINESLKGNAQQKVVKRDSSGSDKRKVYRKTKSDLLVGHRLSGSSFDSEKASSNYPARRIRSQDNLERSWREYRERKKLERMQKENCNLPDEEDFMRKPRWKDFQKTCQLKNCKFCENMRDCVDQLKDSDSTVEVPKERPGTSLQENYIMIDPPKSPDNNDEPDRISPDFGYNSISKQRKKSTEDSYTSSSVKKSDTFKIVDGGDDDGEVCYDYSNKTNEEIAKDYLKRVYELLRRRQEEAKNRLAEGYIDERYEDTSSSNCMREEEEGEQIKKRRRRRKMDKMNEGNLMRLAGSDN